ncbi:winged helix-turn-helix domain-containing protein [Thalassotalea marina]|uniref:OmpR/PhoB-type domain-containing protein n=1 Tax=Thalassotalea marina TaxID=1673741 RepID=A0A919EMH1_9GAMM|nr:winged helix-turn-helix domain-containing protein [Thalassotalea marina]GHG00100.1 hypothetical protein GCM10017161_30900 [Thalassotalea marina]
MERFEVYVADVFVDFVNRQLVYQSKTRQLEPKVFRLLEVLIDADGDLVSRDQLIERVWDGRVVGEGAINRTVSILRQHFAEFDENKDFIVTVPKAGYKLQFLTKIQISTTKQMQQRKWHVMPLVVSMAVLFVIVLIYWFIRQPAQKLITFEPASRVSAQPGVEYNISTDKKAEQLLFTKWSNKEANAQLELKLLASGQSKPLIGLENNNVISQQLSPNGQLMVYAYRKNDRCYIALYHIVQQKTRDIHTCAQDSLPKFTWHWNNEYVYFRERIDKTQPYTISRFNLATDRLSKMSLPPSDGNVKGDYLISHHGNQNQLLIVRYIDESRAQLVVLNSFNGAEIYSKTVELHIDNAVWLTDNLVALVEKKQLYTFNVATSELTEQFNTPQTISSLSVAEQTLFYSSLSQVTHIIKYDVSNASRQVIDEANALAQLPRVSKQENLIYLSDKTGQLQIHMLSAEKQTTILTELPLRLGFDRIEWAANGEYLLLSRQGAIFRFDVKSQKLAQLLDESAKAYVVNFGEDHNDIIYGSNRSGQWQLWRYNVTTKQNQPLTKRGGYSGRLDNNILYFTKFAQAGLWQLDLKKGEEQLVIEDVDIINWLNWQLIDQFVYFYRPESGIWQFNLTNQREALVMPLYQGMLHQFSVSSDHQTIYVTESAAVEGDVYKSKFSITGR